MLAEVHDGVRAEALLQPAVGGQVVVAGRQVRVVVDGHRVLPEAARRLHQQHDVAGAQRGQHDLAVGVARRGRRTARPGGGPQACSHRRRAARPGSVANQLAVVARPGCARPRRPAAGSVSHSGSWPPAAMSAWISASPSAGSTPGSASGAGRRARCRSRASRRARSRRDRAGRGVQADRVADPGVLGRVGRQHRARPAAAAAAMCRSRARADGDAGHPRGPLGVGDVARTARRRRSP